MRAGLVYAARLNWRVLPLAPGGKKPTLLKWQRDASSDPELIQQWITEYPGANLGVLCGVQFDVLDVDPRNGGDVSLAALIAKHGPLPRTPQAQTGGGGSHYLFKSCQLHNGKLCNGIDIKGVGGQIVVSPSVTTAPYKWVVDPFTTELAEWPEWVLAMLQPVERPTGEPTERGYFPAASPAVLDSAREALTRHGPAIQGKNGDDHTFIACAMLLHDFALTEAEAWPLIQDWNETCVPPWDESGLAAKFRSGIKSGSREYGCRRTLDVVETTRKLVTDWQSAGSQDPMEVVTKVRALTFTDPALRELAENELMAATGLKKRALDLPRPVKLRVIQGGPDGPEFDLSKEGAPLDNLNNVVKALTAEKRDFYWDAFSNCVCHDDGTQWSDTDTAALHIHLQDKVGLRRVQRSTVQQGIHAYATQRPRNPVRDAIAALVWDGTPRLKDFFSRGFGARRNAYTEAAGSNFLRGMMARVLNPGCKVDTMPILEGDQGLGKSTACRILAGQYFGEITRSPTEKDFYIDLQGKMLLEWGELESFNRAETTAIKGCVTREVDHFREPYAATSIAHPRQCVFIGTTNGDSYLRDETGNRRFWPIACVRIDLKWVADNRVQLFAEAVADVNEGQHWWEMPDEATRAEQESRYNADPWEDMITEALQGQDQAVIVDLLETVLDVPPAQMDRSKQVRVASVLRHLGFRKTDGRLNGKKMKFWQRG